jgi:single-strand DNA-binding protein
MSAGYNNVVLLGRLVAPPDQLKTKAGKLFIKATIAASVYRKAADGTGEEHTSFLPATMFGKTAELFLKYVQKGDMVHLVGRLDSTEWQGDDGKKRLSLSFNVEQINFLPNARAKAVSATAGESKSREVSYNELGEPNDINVLGKEFQSHD